MKSYLYKLAFLFVLKAINEKNAFAANSITVQGVMRDSAGDLVDEYSPVGGIKAVFYHATHCATVVNGDADLLGCAPSGAIGSEVIDPFEIKAGAFSLSIVPTAGTTADMATTPTGWYVKIRGVFAVGAPVGEFLIPLDSVPFSKIAEVAASVSATSASGNSVIDAINATASGDTKINADRIPSLDGSTIASGTIGGSTSVSTTGTIDAGTITSTSTVSGSALSSTSLGSAAAPAFKFGSDANTGMFSSGSDTLEFSTGGVSRMSIDSNGNVATNSLSVGSSTAVTGGVAWFNGNVGIGTSSPVSKLQIGSAPIASANYGLLSLGSGAFDGSTSGYYAGSSNGTMVAVNAASGFSGDLLNLQVDGVPKVKLQGQTLTLQHGTGGVTNVSSDINLAADQGHSVSLRMMPLVNDGSGYPAHSFNLLLNNANEGLIIRDNSVERFRFQRDGNMGIGTSNPGASSILDISSTTKGVVLPRMSKTQRDAIAAPVAGMAVYQNDNTPGLRVFNGTNWIRFTETTD